MAKSTDTEAATRGGTKRAAAGAKSATKSATRSATRSATKSTAGPGTTRSGTTSAGKSAGKSAATGSASGKSAAAKSATRAAATTSATGKPATKRAAKPAGTKPAATKSTGRSGATKPRKTRSVEEVERIRIALDARRGELREEYQAHLAEIAELQRDRLTDSAGDDQADTGSKTFEREQEISLANSILERITQVERALERLDEGSYGWCERCGDAIPVERLAAFPSATLCVKCKQLEERR